MIGLIGKVSTSKGLFKLCLFLSLHPAAAALVSVRDLISLHDEAIAAGYMEITRRRQGGH